MCPSTSLTLDLTAVNLKELGLEGETFHFSRTSGELNAELTDLIGAHEYQVNLTIRPMGNVFDISGNIATTMDLLCSHCGRDATTPIRDEFHEIILVLDERPRAGHSGHTGTGDEGPFCNYVSSYVFDLADFVHEHIAATEPYKVLCDRSDCDDVFKGAQVDNHAPVVANNPFAVLKGFKAKED